MSKMLREFYPNITSKEGDVGIEIELEGINLPRVWDEFWRHCNDGSLRGEALEYVMKNPCKIKDLDSILDNLAERLDEEDIRVNCSFRCGVHVHVNVQKLTVLQLYNFITLYIIMEKCLMRFCGGSRYGNYFCLKASDAEYLLQVILESITEGPMSFRTDNIRYSSMNLSSLDKYCSMEFRGLRSDGNFDLISIWASILLRIRSAAKRYSDPISILESVSSLGHDRFIEKIFGKYSRIVKGNLSSDKIEEMVYSGVRLTQDYVYSPNWDNIWEGIKINKKKL